MLASIQVWIDVFYLIEYSRGLVAVHVALLIVCFERITFNDEQGVVVERSYLSSFPCQQVHINVAVPLSDNRRFATVHHQQTVEYHNHRPVGLIGATANVHDSKVAVCHLLRVIRINRVGQIPNPQHTLCIGLEPQIAQSVLALIAVRIYVAHIARRLLCSRPQSLHTILVEYSRAGVYKCLYIIRRIFGSH